MPVREYVIITTEQTAGSYDTSSTPAPTVLVIPLDGPNSLAGVPKPEMYKIRSAHTSNKLAIVGSQRTSIDLKLKTHFYTALAPILVGWSATEIGSTQTTPWTTTEPIGDLASVTIDHAHQRNDLTWKTRRFLGCKSAGFTIDADFEGQAATIEIDIKGMLMQGNSYDGSTDPALTPPALTAYPGTDIYTFQGTKGGFTYGSVRTLYRKMSFSVKNTLYAPFDEGHFVDRIRYHGRDASLQSKLLIKGTPDDRTDYEKILMQAANLVFTNGAGTHTCTFACNAQNVIADLTHDLPLDQDFYWDMKIDNMFDPVAGTDFTVSFT